MSEVLSTFSRLEQSRFEAFRRATFCGNTISRYVAHCLIKQHSSLGDRRPVLSEVCAEGQAEEITIVVSTLAKAYAQRLVTAARRLGKRNYQGPVQPTEILKAYEKRRLLGLDPGFFLQSGDVGATGVLKDESYDRRRLAVLHAQDKYDREHGVRMDIEDNATAEQNMMDSAVSISPRPDA